MNCFFCKIKHILSSTHKNILFLKNFQVEYIIQKTFQYDTIQFLLHFWMDLTE